MSSERFELPTPIALWRLLHQWRRKHLVEPTDRVAVLSHVADAGTFGPRFAFLMLMSVGIAMFGLLQNSAAVIIGAMLIAPLMGPIIELGMGLATFDLRTVRSALRAITGGIALALAMAMPIVWASPLQQATPEILARTQPTFFDLMVAVFSGLAGAYATISRKGEAIVGVAIATSLVPPLAVLAYGLALRNMGVAGGAGLLFMTNLLAIALSATMVARLYGFGGTDSPRQTAWQAFLIIGTFILLSIPLGLSLQRIARQTQLELGIRAALDAAASEMDGRISALRVDLAGEAVTVDAVLMTPRHVNGIDARLSKELSERMSRRIDVQLREVLTADDARIAREQATLSELGQSIAALQQAEAERGASRRQRLEMREAVLERLAAPVGTLEDATDGGLILRIAPASRLSLDDALALERQLQAATGSDAVRVLPPLQRLAAVPWQLDDDGRLRKPSAEALDVQMWALRRWGVGNIEVVALGEDAAAGRQRAIDVAVLARHRGVPAAEPRVANPAERASAGVEGEAVWLRLPADPALRRQ